jgi:hypothetical protein
MTPNSLLKRISGLAVPFLLVILGGRSEAPDANRQRMIDRTQPSLQHLRSVMSRRGMETGEL